MACESDERGMCEACSCDDECGKEGVCIDLPNIGLRCTTPCTLSLNDCEPGFYCSLTGNTSADFHCLPRYGDCTGDGGACSPCSENEACNAGLTCHTSSVDLAQSCFTVCENDSDCGGEDSTGEVCKDELCVLVFDGVVRDVCNTGNRELCEPCAYSFDCRAGLVCVGSFCTEPCEKLSGTSSTCPEGMFCPKGVCEPPPAYKCQGWFGCSFGCKTNEVCEHGICRIPCEVGCPVGVTCSEDGIYCSDSP